MTSLAVRLVAVARDIVSQPSSPNSASPPPPWPSTSRRRSFGGVAGLRRALREAVEQARSDEKQKVRDDDDANRCSDDDGHGAWNGPKQKVRDVDGTQALVVTDHAVNDDTHKGVRLYKVPKWCAGADGHGPCRFLMTCRF